MPNEPRRWAIIGRVPKARRVPPRQAHAEGAVRRWTGHADIKVLIERYSHEFESARGGRRIEEDIAKMDAAYGQ